MAMEYLVGIDGGGSKTKLQCFDLSGNVIGETTIGATYYRQDGVEAVIERLQQGFSQCLPRGTAAAVCFGMPGYSEDPQRDYAAAEQIAAAFPDLQMCFQNDVAVGWAGSMALSPGVSIIGGTGAMSYGRDASGASARCGGWHEFFSDEGSGYWLGKQLLRLFSHQSDHRLPKTQLYELVRERLSLQDDFDIVNLVEQRFADSRKETAALQRILLEAARLGDPCALEAYQTAARYLAEIACGCVRQLDFPSGCVSITCVGGLFNLDDLINTPIRREIARILSSMGMEADFSPSLLPPCAGAALFAAEAFLPRQLDAFRSALLEKSKT